MKIDTLTIGDFLTNCYILRGSLSSKDCLVIDPGLQAEPVIDLLQASHLQPVAVILTHGHIDHIAGVHLIKENWPDIKICIHSIDAPMLKDDFANLSEMADARFETDAADCLLEHGQLLDFAGIKLLVLHTPGHTPGGICLYSQQDKIIFVGDTLFADSVGRTDFPGGSTNDLLKSINEKLLTLPDETEVFPGHGPATTIGKERKTNPFL